MNEPHEEHATCTNAPSVNAVNAPISPLSSSVLCRPHMTCGALHPTLTVRHRSRASGQPMADKQTTGLPASEARGSGTKGASAEEESWRRREGCMQDRSTGQDDATCRRMSASTCSKQLLHTCEEKSNNERQAGRQTKKEEASKQTTNYECRQVALNRHHNIVDHHCIDCTLIM